MTLSLSLACIWGVIANILAMTPSKDNHWRTAYALIAVGIPILGYITVQHGPWVALIVMVAGCWLLRWPVIYLTRWAYRLVSGRKKEAAE